MFSRICLVVWIVVSPAPALACDWGYGSWPDQFGAASDVFVGTAIASPFALDDRGVLRQNPGRRLDEGVRFSVQTRYKGPAASQMVAVFASDCSFPFAEGETYLVHGVVDDQGRFYSGYPSRPVRMSGGVDEVTRRDLAEALKYLQGRAAGRPQAFIHGSFHFLDAAGSDVRASPSDEIIVRAEPADGGAAVTIRAPNNQYDMFQMVLTPGSYAISVERNGTRAGTPVAVQISEGEALHLPLGPGWSR